MSKRKRRVFSREFKLSAVQRMIAGESAAELSESFRPVICGGGACIFAKAEASEGRVTGYLRFGRTISNSPMKTMGALRYSKIRSRGQAPGADGGT